jgi:hypothetical protein
VYLHSMHGHRKGSELRHYYVAFKNIILEASGFVRIFTKALLV